MSVIPVLLAEDEDHIARLIRFKLEKEGFQVSWARNGQDAIDVLQAKPGTFRAVVLDVMMPVKDGWEVLEFIRGDAKASSVPVLMLTAKGEQQVAARAAELGAAEVLKKPFDPEDLVRALRRILA